jgi:hypothetical protein
MKFVYSKPYENRMYINNHLSLLFSPRILFKHRKLNLHRFKIVPVFYTRMLLLILDFVHTDFDNKMKMASIKADEKIISVVAFT